MFSAQMKHPSDFASPKVWEPPVQIQTLSMAETRHNPACLKSENRPMQLYTTTVDLEHCTCMITKRPVQQPTVRIQACHLNCHSQAYLGMVLRRPYHSSTPADVPACTYFQLEQPTLCCNFDVAKSGRERRGIICTSAIRSSVQWDDSLSHQANAISPSLQLGQTFD